MNGYLKSEARLFLAFLKETSQIFSSFSQKNILEWTNYTIYLRIKFYNKK